jgi:hypothetical protein
VPEYRFHFHLSREDYLRYYKGAASVIIARAEDGTRVQFPASAMRPYITTEGVSGSFLLVTDDKNKLLALKKV